MSARAEVTALHEDQLLEVFRRLGLSSHYYDGVMSCAICHDCIDHRLGAIRLVGGELIAACGRLECLEGFHG